jgi:hypothetical protein
LMPALFPIILPPEPRTVNTEHMIIANARLHANTF